MARAPAASLLFFVVLAGAPAPRAEASDLANRLTSHTLENGLRVSIFADERMPVVSTEVWYHVGAANEKPEFRGFAHLFEHLMFGATENYGKDAYANHHHRHGGYQNAYTTEDETVYVSQIAPEHHRRVLEMEADRMVHLVMSQENLDNEKKIVTEELRLRTENHPEIRVYTAALAAVLGDHPYAITPVGTKEDIARATLDECRRFYSSYYRPRNAHLVIAGPVNPEAKLAAVRELFGPLPEAGVTPPDVPPVVGRAFPDEVELEEDLPPVETALVAYPLPPSDSGDHDALQVLSQLLVGSGVDPFADELVRRRGKAVFASTEIIRQRRGGAIVFTAAYLPYRRKATAFRLIEETREKVSRLDWLTDESLAAAKRTMLRRGYGKIFYSSSMANALGRALWWHGDEAHALDAEERIRRVTREQVAAVYEKYVVDQKPVRVYIKPEHVPWYVRLFGWLYPLVKR